MNIIVLFFGFKKADTIIENAIKEVYSRGKIIFAIISNSGYIY